MACVSVSLMAIGAVASCGARTGLVEGEPPDASVDSMTQPDVLEEDIPVIDMFQPDVPIINPCPDAAATLIYVIGESNTLYAFDPSTGQFPPIGPISCDDPSDPFSMAVDREGIAYTVFSSGRLYRVSTKSAHCERTAYNAAANGDLTFGMGFVANVGDGGDAGETLFVSKDLNGNVEGNGELAIIDTSSFALTNIADFSPEVPGAELTGTGGGRLFAFSPVQIESPTSVSFIAEIDPATAKVIAKDDLPGITQGKGWAFGFWGGDFYTFTAPNMVNTVVNRFDPVSKSITQVATISDIIVGAGVSTCAPQN
jgi:hypothetical protein